MRHFLLSTIAILLFSCRALQPESGIVSLGTHKWKLTAIAHKPVSAGDKAYLEFDEKEMEIKGKVFCNTLKAGYELMGKDQLTFEEIITTKMYCEGVMDLEQQMMTGLENTRRYEIKNGTLYLYDTENLLLTFKK